MQARNPFFSWLLILGLGLCVLAKPEASAVPPDSQGKKIAELIGQLGSAKFQERNAAQKELEAIGSPALPLLKKAQASADLEASKRAGDLVRKIEDKIFSANLLAPKRVHLKIVDLPVADAVKELSQLSGYTINIIKAPGDVNKFEGKKITLDTGDVTFWEAFDKLCAQAGLVEHLPAPTTDVIPMRNLKRPNVVVPAGALPVLPPANPQPAPPLNPGAAVPPRVQAPAVQLAQVRGQVQIQVQGGIIMTNGQVSSEPGAITLVPGARPDHRASYAGAVCARLIPSPSAKAGCYQLTLSASAEPRLQGFSMVGNPTIDKAIDDQGQTLTLDVEPLAPANPNPQVAVPIGRIRAMSLQSARRQLDLRFKAGEKPAKKLKELAGSFTAQVYTPPEALLTMKNVLKAAGESVTGPSGGAVKLNKIDKLTNGDYQLQVVLENAPGPGAVGAMGMNIQVIQMQQIQIRIGGNQMNGRQTPAFLDLIDAKGNKYQPVQVPSRRMSFVNGMATQEITIIFHADNGQGDPERLVVTGNRLVNVTIPFVFRDVPLE